MDEDDLTREFDSLFASVEDPGRVVFNAHPPPFDSGLDEAPVLDAALTVQQSAGQVKLGPVGSTAVRAAIERYQPILSLHGHVHESRGVPPHRPHARASTRAATTARARSTAPW